MLPVDPRFAERMKTEHARLLHDLPHTVSTEERQRRAVRIVNRLLFVRFLQAGGLLDHHADFLRDRLRRLQQPGGYRFSVFFDQLWERLFGEPSATAKPPAPAASFATLLPESPLRNGPFNPAGLHISEPARIRLPDHAFARLFDFFDQFQWRLEERVPPSEGEVNPRVLGFVLEHTISQKPLGAYYTPPDLTQYMATHTLIPGFLAAVRKRCPGAFQPLPDAGATTRRPAAPPRPSTIWGLLRDSPDAYLDPAIRHGAELPLPEAIASGIPELARREVWDRPAPAEFALPSETWRTCLARHKRCRELRRRLASGRVACVEELVRLNLDLSRFARDAVTRCDYPGFLAACDDALRTFRVLDPACGSGEFLLAALDVLEPLYAACRERMPGGPAPIGGPRFLLRSTIVARNLFGVDLMPEAVEVCRLRLLLKLIAPLPRGVRIPPLPVWDRNIRRGNSLVGYVSLHDLGTTRNPASQTAAASVPPAVRTLEAAARRAVRADKAFRGIQDRPAPTDSPAARADRERRRRQADLAARLDQCLARGYGIAADGGPEFAEWRDTHQPFHWLAEFPAIVADGGFDVVLGNPPWTEYARVKPIYQVHGYQTTDCGNLHGLATERALQLRAADGRLSFVVQLPLMSAARMAGVRALLLQHSRQLHVAPFDDRPAKLFPGLPNCRSAIFLAAGPGGEGAHVFTAGYQRWSAAARPHLFAQLRYTQVREPLLAPGRLPKYAGPQHAGLFRKIHQRANSTLRQWLAPPGAPCFVFYQEATRYWIKATLGLPFYAKNGVVGPPAHGRYLWLADPPVTAAMAAVLNSSLFYLYFITFGDGFHLSDALVHAFPLAAELVTDRRLAALGGQLQTSLNRHARQRRIQTRQGDRIEYAEFLVARSKPLIDDIDRLLAKHYRLTPTETDFVIHYDQPYRMAHRRTGP